MTTDERAVDEFADFDELMTDGVMPDGEGLIEPRDDPDRRRRRRRAGIAAAIVCAVIVGTLGAYAGWALTAPVAAPGAASAPPPLPVVDAADIYVPPDGVTALSVAGAADYLGPDAEGIWLTSGSNDPRPMASLTKLITALVVLDAHPLANATDPGPMITFGKRDHDLYDKYYVMGATIAPMPTGVRMSQNNALSAMLVPSASNYAEAVSTWAFGSQWGFVRAAEAWLAKNGLTGTTVVEPSGIDPRNLSTPSDLIAIGKLAAADPVVASIVAKTTFMIPGVGAVSTTNLLLGQDGITGLKTGNLGPDRVNFLYSAQLDLGVGRQVDVIGVVLGGASRVSVYRTVELTIDSLRTGFRTIPLAQAGDEIGRFTTEWGADASLVVAEDAAIYTWSDTPVEVALDVSSPHDYVDGERIGTITWTAGPNTVTVPVEVEGSIRPPDAWWRLTHPAQLGG